MGRKIEEAIVIRVNGEKPIVSLVRDLENGEKGIKVRRGNGNEEYLPILQLRETFRKKYPEEPIKITHISYEREEGRIVVGSGKIIRNYE